MKFYLSDPGIFSSLRKTRISHILGLSVRWCSNMKLITVGLFNRAENGYCIGIARNGKRCFAGLRSGDRK